MGIRGRRVERIGLKLIALISILALAYLLPWWLTVALGAAYVLLGLVTFEIVIVGLLLDYLLTGPSSGLFGLFYTPVFFIIILVFVIVKSIRK